MLQLLLMHLLLGGVLCQAIVKHKAFGLNQKSIVTLILELGAVELDLLSLLRYTTNQHIRILSDNVTTVIYINALGACKSKQCNNIAKRIWSWATSKHNWLSSATYQPGHLNTIADNLSRHFGDTIEWKIYTRLFGRIGELLGKPGFNLFASR